MIGFITLDELGVFGAKAFWGGEESRAKDAKDAKVKGMEDDEIVGGRWGSGGLCFRRNWMIKADKGRGGLSHLSLKIRKEKAGGR